MKFCFETNKNLRQNRKYNINGDLRDCVLMMKTKDGFEIIKNLDECESINFENGELLLSTRKYQKPETYHIDGLEYIKQQQEQEKHLRNMQELKTKIDAMTVKVGVKVGANGKLFGSVSTKEIVEEFKNQNNIELDKRKIQLDKVIDCLGTYKIPIDLHKEVNRRLQKSRYFLRKYCLYNNPYTLPAIHWP